jgi:acyl-CoA thioester hydrolase
MTDPLPTAGVFVGREHRLPIRVYYEDTDFTGLVYHAGYARWFERGRSEFLRLAGVEHTALMAEDAAVVVTRLCIDYRKPARIDDALVVITSYESFSGPRVKIAQRIERGGELLVSAEVDCATITMGGRPRRPPASLAKALGPYLATAS